MPRSQTKTSMTPIQPRDRSKAALSKRATQQAVYKTMLADIDRRIAEAHAQIDEVLRRMKSQ